MRQVCNELFATLSELIESNPCLWYKTSGSYKGKIEMSKAWKEFCAFLEGDFHQMDIKKRHKISKCTFINTF